MSMTTTSAPAKPISARVRAASGSLRTSPRRVCGNSRTESQKRSLPTFIR